MDDHPPSYLNHQVDDQGYLPLHKSAAEPRARYDRFLRNHTLRMTMPTEKNGKVLLRIRPRGFCAGVVRAVDIVELALEAYGAPGYVHHEIVHKTYVVEQLRRRGAQCGGGALRVHARAAPPRAMGVGPLPTAQT